MNWDLHISSLIYPSMKELNGNSVKSPNSLILLHLQFLFQQSLLNLNLMKHFLKLFLLNLQNSLRNSLDLFQVIWRVLVIYSLNSKKIKIKRMRVVKYIFLLILRLQNQTLLKVICLVSWPSIYRVSIVKWYY